MKAIVRSATGAVVFFGLSAFGQSLLNGKASAGSPLSPPASTATSTPPASTRAAMAPTPQSQRSPRRADVVLVQGELSVKAENSSLNQILREIGRVAGIKITGGVADERVYGQYGPAPAAEVLTALLEGTGSNLLIVATPSGDAGELVLTPRRGGATPPNPNATGFDDDDEGSPAPAFVPQAQRRNNPQQTAPIESNESGSPGEPTNGQAPAQPNASGAATPQDPNAIKTPQQIFEQLQRLRQQQQQQQTVPDDN